MHARTAFVLVLSTIPALAGCTNLGGLQQEGPVTTPAADAAWSAVEAPGPHGQPMFQGDIGRTGWYPDAVVPTAVEKKWVVEDFNDGDHTAAKGSAVRADDRVYVGTDSGEVYALTLDGGVYWTAQVGGPPRGTHGTPLVVDDVLYIGAYDGALYALDRHDGHRIWRQQLGGSVAASPLMFEGTIYISVETPRPSGIVYALDPTDGHTLWKDDGLTDHPHSSVAIDPQLRIMVVGDNDGLLYAWDLDSHERIWTFETGGAIKGTPLIVDGGAVFGSWDHSVYRVDLATGAQDWRFETEAKVMGGAALHPPSGAVMIGGHDGVLRALDVRTGKEHWSYRTGDWITGAATVAGDTVLVGSKDNHLYALDAWNGTLVWKWKMAGDVSSAPLVTDGLVIFADRARNGEDPGVLIALGPRHD